MTTTLPTDRQVEILMHSIGLHRSKVATRNHYCTAASDPELEAMVEAGWMKPSLVVNEGQDQYYIVTEAGAKAVGVRLPVGAEE